VPRGGLPPNRPYSRIENGGMRFASAGMITQREAVNFGLWFFAGHGGLVGNALAAYTAPVMLGNSTIKHNGGANLGFEATLWQAACKLWGHLDAAEYKHVVLGMIFVKYISDAFEEVHAKLSKEKGADPEDRDEYRAVNIFWVPPEARWKYLQSRAKDALIGKLIDDAMVAIERDNPSLKAVLPKEYTRWGATGVRLGELIDLIGTIAFRPSTPTLLPVGEGRRDEGAQQYRGGYEFAGLVKRARELRDKQTPAEDTLWELLRDRRFMNVKFRRQHQIGDYLVDFFCNEAKLVVETDGPIHERDSKRKHDQKRDAYLEALGYRVRRFKNEQVEQNPEAVLEDLRRTIEELPSTSGRGAGGEGHSQTGFAQSNARAMDILGRVYEYFLSQFASAEGKKGGQFYTPRCVVQLLVEMLAPYKGRVFDPCCGSGGMFVSSEKFVEAHGGRIGDIAIYGQESNPTTWRLAKMNLAIRGIEADLGKENADSFHRDLHKDLKADFILANPPFNLSDWGGDKLKEDARWKYGVPPAGNANFAWVQHFLHHLSPTGLAGFVLANGSMSSNQSGEGDIRQAIIEADLVDCMVALPGQLFYSTQIPVCLWFLSRDKSARPPSPRPSPTGRGGSGAEGEGRLRDRRGQTLFIDARKLGTLIDRVHRELTGDDIAKITGTYHAWRGDKGAGKYQNVAGFCMSAKLEDIRAHGYVLTPGRYVGAEEAEDDGEPFAEKMKRLTGKLEEQFAESAKLEKAIRRNLQSIQNATR